jgi:hypothetical protein
VLIYRAMRVSPGEYLNLRLRAHELLHDVPLYDVSVMDLPGGGVGRSVADIRALESAAAPSRIANALYGVRQFLGRLFDWDRAPMRPEQSLLSCLSERDRRDSEITPGTRDGPFLLLYQFLGEALSETRNATVHGYVCTALARTATGYRLYWGVYMGCAGFGAPGLPLMAPPLIPIRWQADSMHYSPRCLRGDPIIDLIPSAAAGGAGL